MNIVVRNYTTYAESRGQRDGAFAYSGVSIRMLQNNTLFALCGVKGKSALHGVMYQFELRLKRVSQELARLCSSSLKHLFELDRTTRHDTFQPASEWSLLGLGERLPGSLLAAERDQMMYCRYILSLSASREPVFR